MKNKFLLLLSAFLILWVPKAQGAFEERYWGARVSGLAGAYGIVSDDAAGIFYNVAKLSNAKGRQLEFGYGQLFTGVSGVNLSVSNFEYVHQLKTGVFGIGWGSFGAKDLYMEDVLVLGYGVDVRNWIQGLDREVSVGVSARYLMRRFILDDRTIGDPVFKDGRVNSSIAIDLHLFTSFNEIIPGLGAGVSVKSINRPSVGYIEKEALVPEVIGSIGWKGRKWTIPFDISHQGKQMTPHLGVEYQMLDEKIVVRAGSDISQVGSGFGTRFKYKSIEFSLDYSFLWPLQFQKGAGSHRTSFGMKF